MTIQENISEMLQNKGLFPNQAEEVICLCKQNKDLFPDMEKRWNDNIQDYPSTLISVLCLSVNQVALQWINKNYPKAWYKSLFTE